MALTSFGEGVRGIEDLRIAPLDAAEALGAYTDIVGVRGYSVTTNSDSQSQIGDEVTLFTIQENKQLDVTITSALANLAAVGVATGVPPVESGTAPDKVVTWESPAVSPTAFFQLVGQSSGRDAAGSAFRLTVLKASLTSDPSWNLTQGAWMEPELSCAGVANKEGKLVKVETFQTSEDIA